MNNNAVSGSNNGNPQGMPHVAHDCQPINASMQDPTLPPCNCPDTVVAQIHMEGLFPMQQNVGAAQSQQPSHAQISQDTAAIGTQFDENSNEYPAWVLTLNLLVLELLI
ncbi:hypothetical protein PT974_04056 [Cladobotryum mycophilum]|uniref:Uncharacterized protein n=1 Tax=Cladobotryum mycophilum TaxID=491253 RepID=A0ABR0SV54_9HYPO